MADGAYPQYRPTGASDDMLSILALAESRRYARLSIVLPPKPSSRRPWLEPLGNLFGLGLHAFTRWLLPAAGMNAFSDFVFGRLASPNLFPFERDSPNLAQARRLCRELTGKDGRPPALLCVFSHPPVTGKWFHLNVELTRQALLALPVVRARAVRPRLVVAVDPFALDSFSLVVEGFYAAFMGNYHLGFDRLSSHRAPVSRRLVGVTGWHRIALRLSASLHRREDVGLPLAGGVPTTSRALYVTREYVWDLRRGRAEEAPRRVLERLRADNPDFDEFYRSPLVGERLRRSAWRMMEAWLIAVLAGAWKHEFARDGEPSVDRGSLTPPARAALEACARALGRDPEAALVSFEEEFGRENPYRQRLFRFLARRVISKGTPVVLLPLTHGVPPDVRICWGEPWGLTGGGPGGALTVWKPNPSGFVRELSSPDDFARRFGRRFFL